MKKLAEKTGFIKQRLPSDYPYTRKRIPTWDDMSEDDELALAEVWGVTRADEDKQTDDAELVPSEQYEKISKEPFKAFPDGLLILNDVFLTDVPTTAISIQSMTDVFVGETLRTQAPVISSEGRQDFILNLSLTFPPGEAQTKKLRRIIAEITRHPLVFVYSNRVKKAIGAAESETTMFILESGSLRSTADTVGVLVLDLQMHYFNHKPFSNNFYFNSRIAGFRQPQNENVELVDIPVQLGDLRGYEGGDYSISLAAEKLKSDIREGSLNIEVLKGANVPTSLPSESDAWVYYANHLESLSASIPEEYSDYVGFVIKEYRYFNPPKTAAESASKLTNFQLEYPDPHQIYDANNTNNQLKKTFQEQQLDELVNVEDKSKEVKFKNVKTNKYLTLSLSDYDATEKLSMFANTGKHSKATPFQPELLKVLQKIANQYPGKVIEIISGSRIPKKTLEEIKDPIKREKVRKARANPNQSLHLKGRAMDLRVRGIKESVLFGFLRTLPRVGVGYYPNSVFCHIDSRSVKAEWIDKSGPGQEADKMSKEEKDLFIKNQLQPENSEALSDTTEDSPEDSVPNVLRTGSDQAINIQKEIDRKKNKASGQKELDDTSEETPDQARRQKWIDGMGNLGWYYYRDDPKVRNVFYKEYRADISSDHKLHKQGLVFPDIVCTGISVSFGHRIAPMRLLSQSSYTYQFLGAGNKTGQMVFTFAGERGRQSADELKRMFYLARQNARTFSSLIKDVGAIGVSFDFGISGETNTILALLGIENIVVVNIEEASVPDGVDKHQMVIEFIVQEFAEEKYEKRFVTSIDNKRSIAKGILRHIEVRESKKYNDLNNKSYYIYPSQSIVTGSQTNRGLYTVTRGVPEWVADLVTDAVKFCEEIDQQMPPIDWKIDESSTKTWRDIYAQWGAEKIFHGKPENIHRSETNWKSHGGERGIEGQVPIQEIYSLIRNNPEIKTEREAKDILLEKYRTRGFHKNNGGPNTNNIHKELYKKFVQKIEMLTRKARTHVADEANFKKFIGSAGKDMLDAVIQGLGECYEDMLLPKVPNKRFPFSPEFYVYDDSDENPTLSSLTDKDNMMVMLREHSRVERESIELYMRDRYLGGSYVSKNLPRILANRQAYDKKFRKEYSFMDNFANIVSEGTKAWEPVYYREDMENEDTVGVKEWKDRVGAKLGGGSESTQRLNFMDNLISLSSYIKGGNQWQDNYYNQGSTNKQDLVESIYGESWDKIAFGPNPQYAIVDAITSGRVVPPNRYGVEHEATENADEYSVATPNRSKVSNGNMITGEAEEDKEKSIFDTVKSFVTGAVDTVDTLTDNLVTSQALPVIGTIIYGLKQAYNVVQAGIQAYNNREINKVLEKLDHPDKEKLQNMDIDKEISEFATNNAIGSKSDDISIRRVFPTFKIYFIEDDFEETEKIDGQVVRAFDDFYSYSAVQEIRITRSRKIAADLAIIRLTNIGGLLIRRRFGETDPKGNPAYGVDAEQQGIFADTDKENPFARMIMQDGVKVQIRLGYNGDPDKLESVFLGQIVEISPTENGKILEIMCQGYGAELESIELGPLEDGPVFYSTQEALSATIIQDSIVNFGRQSKFNKYNPAEIRHAFTGGKGEGALSNLNPGNLLESWSNSKMERLLNKYTFLNLPQDDNIFAPPPDTYASSWDKFWNNSCVYRPLKQTPWQIFKEHELRHPGYISAAVPYGHSPRMTMFFGGKLQHYWAHPPSALEVFLTENAHNALIKMRGMSIEDETGEKILQKINTLANESEELTAAVLEDIISAGSPKRTATAIAKQFGRYKPFRNYHYFDSEHHILKNEIRTSVDGTFNEVEILYFEDENDIEDADADDFQENLMELQRQESGFLSIKLDENIPESYIRSYRGEFPSCVTETMARRYTQGIFARHLRDAYKGELIVIGKETIKPYDIVYINDSSINMTGPIEVESVTHIFNRDNGFVSIVTPDLCVEVNDIFSASVFDVAAAGMSWAWGWGDIAMFGIPGVGATVLALKGIGFLGLAAGVKFSQWTQDGAPVVTTPLTFGGKPFMSVTLGPNNTSLFFNLKGKWDQFWDDFDDAWKKFDLAEAMFDTKLSIAQKTFSVFGTGLKGGGR